MRSRPDPSSLRRVNPSLSPGNAGASRRKPKPARPCTVARVVTNRTKRSDQAIALRRRSAQTRRINRLRRVAEMAQNPLDDGEVLDAGDHPQLPAACSEKPELSATSGRGASGSAGSVCSVNTFWPSLGPVAIR